VAAIKLVSAKDKARQLSLFNYESEAKRDIVNQAIDALKRKYGEEVVQRGVTFLAERDRVAVNPFEKKKELMD
jgi:hypothetical protein